MLFHVVNDRHRRRRSMIFTTNKPTSAWGRVLHDDDLAQAIVDRVLERGRILTLDGPSMRTQHLGLDESTSGASNQADDNLARISGIARPEFPEPTGTVNPGLILACVVGVLLFQLFGVYLALHSPRNVRSYVGCGVQLYDHQARGDGTYDVIRCITTFYLPVWALESLRIRPTGASVQFGGNYSVDRYSFDTLGRGHCSIGRVGRLFLFSWAVVPVVALGPSVLAHHFLPIRSGVPASNGATAAAVLAAAWIAVVAIFLHEQVGKIYRRSDRG